jgi:hypothetical protein
MLAVPKFHACQDRSVLGWIRYSERIHRVASIHQLECSSQDSLWTMSGQFCLVQYRSDHIVQPKQNDLLPSHPVKLDPTVQNRESGRNKATMQSLETKNTQFSSCAQRPVSSPRQIFAAHRMAYTLLDLVTCPGSYFVITVSERLQAKLTV